MTTSSRIAVAVAIAVAFGAGIGVGWSLRGAPPEAPITADRPPPAHAPNEASSSVKKPRPPKPLDPDGKVPWIEDTELFAWPTPEPNKDELVQVDDTHFMMDQGFAELLRANQAELMRSVRIIPEIASGKTVGIRLFGVRSDTVLARLGFWNGDVVKTLGGMPLTSPETTLDAYSKLRASRRFAIEVERKGAPITLHYRVTGPSSIPGDAGLVSPPPVPFPSVPPPPLPSIAKPLPSIKIQKPGP
jgi:hypothetical protein